MEQIMANPVMLAIVNPPMRPIIDLSKSDNDVDELADELAGWLKEQGFKVEQDGRVIKSDGPPTEIKNRLQGFFGMDEAVFSEEKVLVDVPKFNPPMNAYCVKCGKKVPIKDAKPYTMKNKAKALKGVCPTCGTGVNRILPKGNPAYRFPKATTPVEQAMEGELATRIAMAEGADLLVRGATTFPKQSTIFPRNPNTSIDKIREDAVDYFNKCKISPTEDDIENFVVDTLMDERNMTYPDALAMARGGDDGDDDDDDGLIPGRNYCLVCQQPTRFLPDDDTLRCEHCMSLPYHEVNDIVLGHRQEWQQMSGARDNPPKHKTMVSKAFLKKFKPEGVSVNQINKLERWELEAIGELILEGAEEDCGEKFRGVVEGTLDGWVNPEKYNPITVKQNPIGDTMEEIKENVESEKLNEPVENRHYTAKERSRIMKTPQFKAWMRKRKKDQIHAPKQGYFHAFMTDVGKMGQPVDPKKWREPTWESDREKADELGRRGHYLDVATGKKVIGAGGMKLPMKTNPSEDEEPVPEEQPEPETPTEEIPPEPEPEVEEVPEEKPEEPETPPETPPECSHTLEFVGMCNPKGGSDKKRLFKCLDCGKHFTKE